ncbi:hypothetical protein OESDEN_24623 [Oesophagostomum dentatum]|uniref:Uncharacterized protein n=1 Tax=Oesophagostomum dentatum TaxID=61180 RepID=A0A0B1RVT9_OESDE|nr:hypothetical protein OESDEN_24623 [Oesophagostomum dentatum]
MTLTTASLILNLISTFGKIAVPSDAGPRPRYDDPKSRLDKDSAFYKNSVIAASSEWGMTLVMQLFILSLVIEMSAARVALPRVIYGEDSEAECDMAL